MEGEEEQIQEDGAPPLSDDIINMSEAQFENFLTIFEQRLQDSVAAAAALSSDQLAPFYHKLIPNVSSDWIDQKQRQLQGGTSI